MRVFLRRFLGAIAYLLALTVVGAVGYVLSEGWPWQESLYMTVITLTAVGFHEVRPLSEFGRNFTMLLLAAGITGYGADHVVSPNVSGAIRMASILLRPEVVSFPGIVTRSEGLDPRFEQAVVQRHTRLDIGDEMIVLGQPEQVARLRCFAQA